MAVPHHSGADYNISRVILVNADGEEVFPQPAEDGSNDAGDINIEITEVSVEQFVIAEDGRNDNYLVFTGGDDVFLDEATGHVVKQVDPAVSRIMQVAGVVPKMEVARVVPNIAVREEEEKREEQDEEGSGMAEGIYYLVFTSH